MKMRKFALAAVYGGAMASGVAFAATTGNVVVTATMPVYADVVVTAGTNSFNLVPGAVFNQTNVATIAISSNGTTTNTITLSSLLASSAFDDGGGNTIAYTVVYDSAGVNWTGALDNVGVLVEDAGVTPWSVTANRQIDISVAAADMVGKPAGAYTDTITVTIAST